MQIFNLRANPRVLAQQQHGIIPLAQAVQRESQSRIGITFGGVRLGGLKEQHLLTSGIDAVKAQSVMSDIIGHPLRCGNYPLELLLSLREQGYNAAESLQTLYRTHLPFVAQDVVSSIEKRQLKVFLLGGAGSGVVSAVQDLVNAFCSAGYFGRAFPMFDPSKKGAPVRGYGIISREPILSHAPFEVPDIVLLFDSKLFPLLRQQLNQYASADRKNIAIIVNSTMDPQSFRNAADFHDPFKIYTLDVGAVLKGNRIPPNYAMIGGMLGVMGTDAVDTNAFVLVVESSLKDKFGTGDKVNSNLAALRTSISLVKRESASSIFTQTALGKVDGTEIPDGQEVLCEDGNTAISRAMGSVLNLFPSVIAAYPITPQTQIVEHLSQMGADGKLSAVIVTPESEHGAGGAILGAARDNVLCFTATSSQGFALMAEIIHTIAGLRMGNVVISNVVRSLNAPLNVENDHGDLNKVGLDAGFIVLMGKDVQQTYDLHLISYLVGMYAKYRDRGNGNFEMIPDRSVMLPTIVASEGFEVSHAPERYLALTEEAVQALYNDPYFSYISKFVQPGKIIGTNNNIMGAIQINNARLEQDYQRHQAMQMAYSVLKDVFAKFEQYTGRKYDFIHQYNVEESDIVFVVAGAANGTFEEVAHEFKRSGINVGVCHPNVLRPFPKSEWAKVLKGKKVFVFDRDDPYGASAGRLATELAWVANEFGLNDTQVFSTIYGLGGRTPTLSLVRDEIYKALRAANGEIDLSREKRYVGVNI